MGRKIAAVFAGAVVWSVLWLSGNAWLLSSNPQLQQTPEAIQSRPGLLIGMIVWACVLSVLAGYTTAAVAERSRAMQAVWALAILQLALGVFFEVSNWNVTPLWYHVIFLVLLVPTTLAGGRLLTRA